MKSLLSLFSRIQVPEHYRFPLMGGKTKAAALSGSTARPHISLKARMLGGQAKTISRLGGSMR